MIFLYAIFILAASLTRSHAQLDDYEAVSASASSEVIQPLLPLTIRQHPASQVAIRGHRVTFKCDFDAATDQSTLTHTVDYSTVRMSWLRDSTPVEATSTRDDDDEHRAPLTTQYVLDRNSLVILAYEPLKHSGQYRCMINHTMYTPPLVVLSEPAQLSAASLDDFLAPGSAELKNGYYNF